MISRLPPARWTLAGRVLFAAIAAVFLAAPTAFAWTRATGPDVECLTPRDGDEWWIINSRDIECDDCLSACTPDPRRLKAERYVPCVGWRRARLNEFLVRDAVAVAGAPITVFYVTGNRDDDDETIEDGLQVYAALVACSPEVSVRFVIWSWPSDKICGPLRDFRVKADRTDCDSFLLASVIADLDPAARLSLIGYSYGARVVSGALHLTAGGNIDCCALPNPPGVGAVAARVVFFAPALDNDWLLPGRRNGLALAQVDRLWTSFNPRDPVLKRYPITVKRADPVALGFSGPARGAWPENYRARLRAQNVADSIGKTHWMEAYLESSLVASQLRSYALWGALVGAP